jgi:hypothetical protein
MLLCSTELKRSFDATVQGQTLNPLRAIRSNGIEIRHGDSFDALKMDSKMLEL